MSKDIFISYSHYNARWVNKLARDLRKSAIDVWLDEWKIRPADSIRQRIEEGIAEYRFFSIVLTHKSISSQWVQKELDAAFGEEIRSSKISIIPLLRERCQIPLLLRGKKYIDFTTSKKYQKGLNELISFVKDYSHDISNRVVCQGKLPTDKMAIKTLKAFLARGANVTDREKRQLIGRLTIYDKSLVPIIEKLCKEFDWDNFDWHKHYSIIILPELLGHFRSETSIEVLGSVIMNEKIWDAFRGEAVDTLGNIGTIDATKLLVSVSRFCNDYLRWHIARALTKVHEGQNLAADRLNELLKDLDDSVRHEAARSLQSIDSTGQYANALSKYYEDELLLSRLEIDDEVLPGHRIEYVHQSLFLYKPEDVYAGAIALEKRPEFVNGMIYWADDACGGWERELLFQTDYYRLYEAFNIDIDSESKIEMWKWQVLYDLVGTHKDLFNKIHTSVKTVSAGFYHEKVIGTDLYIDRQSDCPYSISMRWKKKGIPVETVNDISVKIDEVFHELHRIYIQCIQLHQKPLSEQPNSIRAQTFRMRAHMVTTLDDVSEELLKKSLLCNPSCSHSFYELGVVQKRMGKHKDARQFFMHAKNSNPNSYSWLEV